MCSWSPAGATRSGEDLARTGKVGRSVDAERKAVNERHVDAHPRFERTQLLEAFALLEESRRQRDEARQRGAAIGIDAGKVIVLARAVRDGKAAEIKRAGDAAARSEA